MSQRHVVNGSVVSDTPDEQFLVDEAGATLSGGGTITLQATFEGAANEAVTGTDRPRSEPTDGSSE